jgi:hypothetical protein
MKPKLTTAVAAAFIVGAAGVSWLDRDREIPSTTASPARSATAEAEGSSHAALNQALLAALREARTDDSGGAALRDTLAELEKRIAAIEAAEADKPSAKAEASPPSSGLSDDAFGEFIDTTIRHKGSDRALREQVKSELSQSLSQSPDMDLDDVDCSAHLCRATFTQADGSAPSITGLLGTPPLTGEGFSVTHPDGRTVVYFARAGESLSAVREEALAMRAP